MRQALRSTYTLGGEHLQTLLPEAICSGVPLWGHSSKLACHSGANRTLHPLPQWFWGPSIARDTKAFITACPMPAQPVSRVKPVGESDLSSAVHNPTRHTRLLSPADPEGLLVGPWLAVSGGVGGLRPGGAFVGDPRAGTAPVVLP